MEVQAATTHYEIKLFDALFWVQWDVHRNGALIDSGKEYSPQAAVERAQHVIDADVGLLYPAADFAA